MAWFAVDCNVHTNPKLFDLADALKLDPDTTVGKLSRLWAWAAQTENAKGHLGNIPAGELADIMRWKKKPEVLLDALIVCGFIERDESGISIHDWASLNGKHITSKLKDRERKS